MKIAKRFVCMFSLTFLLAFVPAGTASAARFLMRCCRCLIRMGFTITTHKGWGIVLFWKLGWRHDYGEGGELPEGE